MQKFRIAHLTDTHILRDYRNSHLEKIGLRIYPDSYFKIALQELSLEKPDLLLITGDLIHEGDIEDYRYMIRLIDSYLPDIPLFLCPGNHDPKEIFMQTFNGRFSDHYVGDFNGYRIVSIDTSIEGSPNAYINPDHISWLKEVLKKPSKNGTILIGHHPLEFDQAWFRSDFGSRFWQILDDSDVFAYFCGHSHFGEVRRVHNFLQICGESFAFGVETWGDRVVYTESRGYNCCILRGREVLTHASQLFSSPRLVKEFDDIASSVK